LLVRNVAAVRRFARPADLTATIAGNPASSRLESGVGNCFPGLECDLRNLERRFLPFVEVNTNIGTAQLVLVNVDLAGATAAAAAGTITGAEAQRYADLAALAANGAPVVVSRLDGEFGVLGQLAFDPRTLQPVSMGAGRLPTDCWTAIRMLTEGKPVEVTFVDEGTGQSVVITARRAAYLDDNGALSAAFLPGELTQSLCSPWTHDFRDCGCYYWASNHPDIVQPVYPASPPTDLPAWNAEVQWQRRDRTVQATPPAPATEASSVELAHYQINNRWEDLHFVVNRRERTTPFAPNVVSGTPLQDLDTLIGHLRYAAGVELGVAHEYLAAAYSLKADNDPSLVAIPELRDSVRAARAELVRIAIGEMRHTRAVNDVVRALLPAGQFEPCLRVASQLPASPTTFRPVTARVASRAAIEDFIAIEAPSAGVDGIYVDILATLEAPPASVGPVADEWAEAISSVIAEGEDHYQTFLDMREWLSPFPEAAYLRNPAAVAAAPGQPQFDALQMAYRALLEQLYLGYAKGRFLGAADTNAARMAMVGLGGIDGLAHALAGQGHIVTFAAIADPKFTPIDPPGP